MSFIYKLNPAIKLISVMILTITVFLVDKISICVFLIFSFIIFRIIAKVPFYNFKNLKNLLLLAVFIILIQSLFGPGDTYIIGRFKWEGLMLGLVVACRLSGIMILFPVLASTTPPEHLSMGLNSIGFPYRIAFIITTALNMLPVFREEALVIMDAQKLRGMRHFEKSGFAPFSFFPKIIAYSAIALPLVLGAMRKAQISSAAMDSRGFGVYKTRTWLYKPKINKTDLIFLGMCLLFSLGILLLNYHFVVVLLYLCR